MSKINRKKGKTPRIIRCPVCSKSSRFDETNPFRPFCGASCKNRDTIAWVDEAYRVPGEPVQISDGDYSSEEDQD